MTQPKRGLGRGLDALFGGPATAPAPAEEEQVAPAPDPEPARAARVQRETPAIPAFEPSSDYDDSYEAQIRRAAERSPSREPAPLATVVATPARRSGPDELDIDLIAPNPEQPRTNFEPEKLRELSDSIREHGIIQPLVVARDGDGGYHLVAGERRLQAARLAGLETVPVVLREAADEELLELALIENIQRADLNPVEEAMAYRRLVEEYGMTQEEAHRYLDQALAHYQRQGARCVLVITGIGERSTGGALRRMTPRWLALPPNAGRIIATSPAQKRHGGEGAL
ncbi:MAG TPA: ParB/RepB/Spo0J family partition protein, partial [Tepidiformaceae bacterium]|nr:ParB/RepB/Spo0J family partition protein [Tepidiformaceae bacterium]